MHRESLNVVGPHLRYVFRWLDQKQMEVEKKVSKLEPEKEEKKSEKKEESSQDDAAKKSDTNQPIASALAKYCGSKLYAGEKEHMCTLVDVTAVPDHEDCVWLCVIEALYLTGFCMYV